MSRGEEQTFLTTIKMVSSGEVSEKQIHRLHGTQEKHTSVMIY